MIKLPKKINKIKQASCAAGLNGFAWSLSDARALTRNKHQRLHAYANCCQRLQAVVQNEKGWGTGGGRRWGGSPCPHFLIYICTVRLTSHSRQGTSSGGACVGMRHARGICTWLLVQIENNDLYFGKLSAGVGPHYVEGDEHSLLLGFSGVHMKGLVSN